MFEGVETPAPAVPSLSHHDGAVGVDREDYARMSHPRLLNTVKLSSVVRLLEQVGDSVTG